MTSMSIVLTAVALCMMLSQISLGRDMYFSINLSCTTVSCRARESIQKTTTITLAKRKSPLHFPPFQTRAQISMISTGCEIYCTHHLCLYHVPDGLVEGVDLVGLEVTDDGPDVVQDLLDVRHHLEWLHLDKMSPTLLGNLDKRVTRHVLDSIMSFCRVCEIIAVTSIIPEMTSIAYKLILAMLC